MVRQALPVLLFTAVSCGGSDQGAPALRVGAAASLRGAVEEMIAAFEAAHPGVEVQLNAAASGVLRRQIETGRAADVFLSANRRHMEALVAEGHVQGQAVRVLCSNGLVVASPAGRRGPLASIEDLTDARFVRIAIGSPRTAPVGEAAEAALRSARIWDQVEPRLVMAENATQIAAYVRLGEVDAAVMYATDARLLGEAADTLLEIDSSLHPPIEYTVAPVSESTHASLAEAFVEFTLSPRGQSILRAHGFR